MSNGGIGFRKLPWKSGNGSGKYYRNGQMCVTKLSDPRPHLYPILNDSPTFGSRC